MQSRYFDKVFSTMLNSLPCIDQRELLKSPINKDSKHYEPTLKAINSLLEIKSNLQRQTPSKENSMLLLYCNHWLSDCYVLVADYSNAIQHYDSPQFGSRNAGEANDQYLTLKLMKDYRIDGSDILRIPDQFIPTIAKKDPHVVSHLLTEIVHNYELKHNIDVLKQWQKKHDNIVSTSYNGCIRLDYMFDDDIIYSGRHSYFVFSGCPKLASLSLMAYNFSIPHSNVIFSLELIYKACFPNRKQALAWERKNKTISLWRQSTKQLAFDDW